MEFQASIEMNVQWSPLEAVFSELGEGFGQVAQWSEHGERNPEPDSIWYQPAPEADDSDIVSPATAWALVWYYLMSAEDHLLGAAGVLPAGGLGSQFSSLTLSRASLEASAYAIWLLDSEVGLIERLKRSCIMEVWSCEETRKTLTSMGEFNRMGSDVAVQIEVYTEQRNEKFEWARQNNLVGPTLTAKKWCNEKPKIVDLAKRIDFPPSDEWAEDGTMDVLYRLLSGSRRPRCCGTDPFESSDNQRL